MASTLTRKLHRAGTKVADMTKEELQEMIEGLIDRKMAQWLDPDAGLELRPEIVESLLRQEKDYEAGKRGKSLDEVAARLGID